MHITKWSLAYSANKKSKKKKKKDTYLPIARMQIHGRNIFFLLQK